MEYNTFRAMNSEILLASEGPDASQSFEIVRSFIEASEKRFTRFSQTSELAKLNRSEGTWTRVTPEMFNILQLAQEFHQATAGLFDPSILLDLEQAGYNKSMEVLRTEGADPRTAALSPASNSRFNEMELRPDDLTVLMPAGMRIDLGGIAKGWIAEKGARMLGKFSPAAATNAGGDMFLVGLPSGKSHWEVGLEDPLQPSLDMMTLQVEEGAVATSSVAKRVWQQGNTARHHLIDPRTGQPAQTPWLSVTAFAPSGAAAEVFAKALLIGGPKLAGDITRKNPQINFIAVDRDRQVWVPENGEIIHIIMECQD